MSVYDVLASGRPHRSQIVECIVSTVKAAPASFSDPLYVIPKWNQERGTVWTITRWPALHGSALPTPGAECWVVVSDYRNMAVLWWAGTYV